MKSAPHIPQTPTNTTTFTTTTTTTGRKNSTTLSSSSSTMTPSTRRSSSSASGDGRMPTFPDSLEDKDSFRGNAGDPAIPDPPQPRRRRLLSRSDNVHLAVPLAVQVWNLFVPTTALTSWETAEDSTVLCETNQDDKNDDDGVPNGVHHQDDDDEEEEDPSSNTTTGLSTTKWFQPQHQISLLHRVELEIVVQEPQQAAAMASHTKKQASSSERVRPCSPASQELVLLRAPNDNGPTIHPCWRHLLERPSIDWGTLHRDTYESIEFRFYRVPFPDRPLVRSATGCHLNESESNPRRLFLFSFMAHPSHLVPMAASLVMHQQLPVNTVVVHFSDGTLRILPSHQQLIQKHYTTQQQEQQQRHDSSKSNNGTDNSNHHNLVASLLSPSTSPVRPSTLEDQPPKHGFLAQTPSLPSQLPDATDMLFGPSPPTGGDEMDDDGRLANDARFGDDTFRVLDQVLVPDSVEDDEQQQQQQQQQQPYDDSSRHNNKDSDESAVAVANPANTTTQGSVDEALRSSVRSQDVAKRREQLQRLIREEKEALQRERTLLIQQNERIKGELMPRLERLRQQNQEILEAAEDERREIELLDMTLEMHRIRLVRELQVIFPITKTENGKSPKLRNLPLPGRKNIFTIPDDELSAVLGMLSHVILLLSKYLTVPLRYRILSNSSRSAVQDDRGAIYPLFLARPVEREQIMQGLALLERNVDCIATARGISVESETNVLEKVRWIYESTLQPSLRR